jgi:hypothetical protein
MKECAKNGDPVGFLCAAGLVSHYVGDACQPLHGSMYADGYADRPLTIVHHKRDSGEEYEEESHVGAGVHSTYETKMIDRYSEEIISGLTQAVQAGSAATIPPIQNGQVAAIAIVELMQRTADTIDPVELTDTYVAVGGKSTVGVQDALWNTFGAGTVKVMADGARVLAAIWTGAWEAGEGNDIPSSKLTAIDPKLLVDLYRDVKFVPSLDLDHIENELRGAVTPVPDGGGAVPAHS